MKVYSGDIFAAISFSQIIGCLSTRFFKSKNKVRHKIEYYVKIYYLTKWQ